MDEGFSRVTEVPPRRDRRDRSLGHASGASDPGGNPTSFPRPVADIRDCIPCPRGGQPDRYPPSRLKNSTANSAADSATTSPPARSPRSEWSRPQRGPQPRNMSRAARPRSTSRELHPVHGVHQCLSRHRPSQHGPGSRHDPATAARHYVTDPVERERLLALLRTSRPACGNA